MYDYVCCGGGGQPVRTKILIFVLEVYRMWDFQYSRMRMRMRMSKFMRISADADPDAELRYISNLF